MWSMRCWCEVPPNVAPAANSLQGIRCSSPLKVVAVAYVVDVAAAVTTVAAATATAPASVSVSASAVPGCFSVFGSGAMTIMAAARNGNPDC